jgi:hypothetical protein
MSRSVEGKGDEKEEKGEKVFPVVVSEGLMPPGLQGHPPGLAPGRR